MYIIKHLFNAIRPNFIITGLTEKAYTDDDVSFQRQALLSLYKSIFEACAATERDYFITMLNLSVERVNQILQQETPKKEELETILRSIYTRYMRLYERYFSDIEALNDDVIADLNRQNEETKDLVKYYYLDIPKDICEDIQEFDDTYSAKLLGADWRKTLFDSYRDFCAENKRKNKSAECLKAAFSEHIMEAFYDAMDDIFREGFGTGSKDTEKATSGLTDLLFGENK